MMHETYYRPDMPGDMARFREYLLQRERSKATMEVYMRGVRHLLAFAVEKPWIDKQTLMDFKEYLWDHYKPASCNAVIAGVNQFLECLGLAQLKVKQFKVQGSLMRPQSRYLTEKECSRLIAAAREKKKPRLALTMETIVMTGARISEVKYFTVEAVRKGQVQVRNKGKIRTILVPAMLKRKLLLYAASHKITKGSIFITASGKPVDRSNFWKEMQSLKDAARVTAGKLFPHNLRHLFACTYFRATKDLAALGDILGHSSLNVTRIYTMKTVEMQRKTLNRLETVINKKTDGRLLR